jgi:hypothetical protein
MEAARETAFVVYSKHPYGRFKLSREGVMKTRFEMNIEVETMEALRIRANGFPIGEIIRCLIDAYLEDDVLPVPQIAGTKARRRHHRSVASKAIAKMSERGHAGCGGTSAG